jgi:hypothetical protein
MSITRNVACLALLLSIASPVFSQSSWNNADPQAMEKSRQRQEVLNEGRELAPTVARDKNAVGWLDISTAPSFPVPLFRGNQTKYLRLYTGAGAALEGSMSKHGRQMNLTTRDSSGVVFQWYTKYLPSSGYKLDDKFPKAAPGSRAYLVKANSEKSQAMITIVSKDDAYGPASQIIITVSPKPAVRISAK